MLIVGQFEIINLKVVDRIYCKPILNDDCECIASSICAEIKGTEIVMQAYTSLKDAEKNLQHIAECCEDEYSVCYLSELFN